MNTLSKILKLLNREERKMAAMLLGMIMVMAMLDVIGVGSVMPFIGVLAKPEMIDTNPILGWLFEFFEFKEIVSFQLFLGLLFFLALLISIVFKAVTIYYQTRFIYRCEFSIGKRLVDGYLRQPFEWFLNRNSAELGKSVLSEVKQVVDRAILTVMTIISQGVVIIALFTLLVIVNPYLSLSVIFILGAAYTIIFLKLKRFIRQIGNERLLANEERFKVVAEAFGGIKDLKIFRAEPFFLKRFNQPAEQYTQHQASAQVAAQMPRFALEVVGFGGILIVLLYLISNNGGLDNALPVVALFALAGYRLLPALQQVYANLSNLRFVEPALDTLHKEFNSIQKLHTYDTSTKSLSLKHNVSFKGVYYNYPGASISSLSNINIEIQARTKVGIVGASGSGKTTLVDLLLGLLKPDKGEIIVDGQPLSLEDYPAWQRIIGYVPQNIYLTDDTIASNIAYGVPLEDINFAAVESVARIANLHDFIITQLPEGYTSRVGEKGIRLSGGQRQRIGIARALYHEPSILILDEATSALDRITEQSVIDAVNKLEKEITIVTIAHRISTVRNYEHIYILDNGGISDQGTFHELLERNAYFRKLADKDMRVKM